MKSLLFAAIAFIFSAMVSRAAAPEITAPSVSVSGTTATITGSVRANDADTTVRVDYGETTTYNKVANAAAPYPASQEQVPFSVSLTGLSYGGKYFYKVTAANGTLPDATSSDLNFTVPAISPTLAGVSASISGNTATITGTVTANGAVTTLRADYGGTIAYGAVGAPASTFPLTSVDAPFTISLTGLSYGQTYHYKVTASNGVLPNFSTADVTFFIPEAPPLIGTATVNVLDSKSATISALVTPRTASSNSAKTKVHIIYGTSAATLTESTDEKEISNAQNVVLTLSGLNKTTYFYKILASTGALSSESTVQEFRVPQAPEVKLARKTEKSTAVDLFAEITLHGEDAKLTVFYGETAVYDLELSVEIPTTPEDTRSVTRTLAITGLKRDTTYHYKLQATNSAGSGTSADATFKTKANQNPIAVEDVVKLEGRKSVAIAILANDSDPEKDPFVLESVTQPTHGTVAVTGEKVVYTPNASFSGSDAFTYTIVDDQDVPGVAIGRVTIKSIQIALDKISTSAMITDADGNSAGAFRINGTNGGKFTARISIGGEDSVVAGQFDADGKFYSILPDGTGVRFTLKEGDSGNSIAAEFQRDGEKFTADTPVNEVTSARNKELAGLYTIGIPAPGATNTPGQSSTGLPEGAGFIRMTVKEWGGVRVQGILGDGSKFSYASTVSGTDSASVVPIWLSPRDARVSGQISLSGTSDVTATGELSWYNNGSKHFKDGFYTTVTATGAEYTPPDSGSRLLNAGSSDVTLTAKGGNLSGSLVENGTIDSRNRVDIQKGFFSDLKVDSKKGVFSGKIEHPTDGDKRSFTGVLLPQQGKGTAVFTGVNQTGTVELAPGRYVAPTPTPAPTPDGNTGNNGNTGGIDLGNPGVNVDTSALRTVKKTGK